MRVFVIAGEASGDKLGAACMAGLKELAPDVVFQGIGGVGMEAEGLNSQFPMSELSLMGIAEILPKYFHLKRRIQETAAAILAWKPDVVVTIDAPDFCFRVAKLVKKQSPVPIVHYVAPSVWAWRPKRAFKMAGFIDHVLALLPFEPPLMHAAGMGASFVGHPVVAEPVASYADVATFRAKHGLGDNKVLLVLPGSRRGEIARQSELFGQIVERLVSEHPDLRVVIPVAQGVASELQAAVQGWAGAPILIPSDQPEEKRAAFKAADAALAVSGTVALELAAAQTPMVVTYDFNWLSRQIVLKMLITDSVNLVNLVSDTRVVPEFLGDDCQVDTIAPVVTELLENPATQIDAMRVTMERLGLGGEAPGLRAARVVLNVAGEISP